MLPAERRVTETMLAARPREYSAEVTIISLLLMSGVTLLCLKEGPQLCNRLVMIPEAVRVDGEYWRLWTGMAVHADLPHFAFNALFFGFFVYLIYGYFGFWAYPFWTLLLGGLTGYLSLLTYPPGTHLLGASGLVYLMAGFWLTMYVFVERRHSVKRRLLHAVGVALVVFVPTSLQQGISYRTHAIGFGLGLVLAIAYFLANKKRIRSAETVEFEPEPDSLFDEPE
jgi:membrane associated rhomboid family serine protease